MNINSDIVTDGLVFGYDADDRSSRFYKGEPTTNLCTYTLDFSSNWFKNGSSITNNVAIAPDNTFTASMWTCTNSTNHQLYQTHNNSGSPRVFSIYVKKTIYPACYLAAWNANYAVYFDLNDGVISKTFGNGVIGGIKYIDNGWFRIFIYMPSLINEVQVGFLDTIYTGLNPGPWGVSTVTGTSGYIWGPQIEAKQHPTPYIPNIAGGTAQRTSTQSLLNLKDKTPINVSNMSFDWTGHPYFFIGDTNNINAGLFPELDTGNVTVDFWVKGKNSGVIVGKHYNNFEIRISDTKFGGYIGRTGGWQELSVNANVSHDISITDLNSKYNHFCYVMSFIEKKISFYSNGVLKGVYNYPLMFHYTTGTNLFIGSRHDGTGYFKGDIKLVKIYKKSLTSSEVELNYNSTKSRFKEENDLADGLVLHLDAENKNSLISGSTTWYDLTSSNNGTLTNGPTISNVPESLSFDGIDDYCLFAPNTELDNLKKITISLFVNIVSGYGVIISKYISAGGLGFVYYAGISPSLNQRLYIRSDYSANSTATLTSNTWAHIAVTYDGVNIVFYKNGVLTNSVFADKGDLSSTPDTPMKIGNLTVEPLKGKIGNIKIYNRSLSQEEITKLFNTDRGRFGI